MGENTHHRSHGAERGGEVSFGLDSVSDATSRRVYFEPQTPNPKPQTLSPRPQTPAPTHGFSLVELLVAMAVFGTVMAGITMLFVSSVRSVKQGTQNIDAFSTARATFDVIDRDLTTAFTSRDRGDYYNFFGTPIGFTFIGVVDTSGFAGGGGDNLARITYVLHVTDGVTNSRGVNSESVTPENPNANIVTDTAKPAKTFALIRYVEPNVNDLDNFPIDWNQPAYPDTANPQTLAQYASTLISATDVSALSPAQASLVADEFARAAKREAWIRMLAGEVGNAWNQPNAPNSGLLNRYAGDYVISDGIILEDGISGSIIRTDWSTDFGLLRPLFTYGGLDQAQSSNDTLVQYWNAPWNVRTSTGAVTQTLLTAAGSAMRPRIPAIVQARLQWMFSSPYPGAPDFKRAFDKKIDIPTGYTRQDLTKIL
ncbi:MAG: prepilin-type N-terminal cleavage/methylation domain-containing protein [Candidatus Hydrogenedentes bacterium]|nr:prepilin-type N-terminal cleavage/methylation domain-containing protein [Candidatus Hydrogenedentota bacterium]